jgi:hypothetical protein
MEGGTNQLFELVCDQEPYTADLWILKSLADAGNFLF